MKASKLFPEKVKNLPAESVATIEKENLILIQKSGAKIEIIEIQNDLIKVQVKNINGKKVAKHKLLAQTYTILNRTLPPEYRVSIKL